MKWIFCCKFSQPTKTFFLVYNIQFQYKFIKNITALKTSASIKTFFFKHSEDT